MTDEFNTPATSREEQFLTGIMRAAQGGDEVELPTPVWDYEKRLYDIWLAAKGEDPIYNLPVRTQHPDAFYNAIRDALAEGGGGEQIYELIGEGEYQVSTTSTSETAIGDLNLTKNVDDVTGYLYIRIRDKAGKRAGYFYGMDAWVHNMVVESGSIGAIMYIPKCLYAYDANMKLRGVSNSSPYTPSGGQGVFAKTILRTTNAVKIVAKYSSTVTGTIDGTYLVQVYAVKYPNGTF